MKRTRSGWPSESAGSPGWPCDWTVVGDVTAVVPVKELARSKSRLADVLTAEQRATLSLGMLRRVLAAAIPVCGRVAVVGKDERVREVATKSGAEWAEDTSGDLTSAVSLTFSELKAEGAAPVYLPADLPFVGCEDVQELLRVSQRGTLLTLAPARFDGGTNAIVVPADSPFEPALTGHSFERHREAAWALGLKTAYFDSPGLGIDIDRPEDLALAESIEPGITKTLTGG